jgi:DNA polymerase-3 subunit gamma/tau
MSYVVLARKWRPMQFRDLVGQEHVARTLANAIEQQRVAHAFLFTGVRGVGKTTSARILAKALNCLQPGTAGDEHGIEPCLTCAACREISEGLDVDVREIDGASYTGVDEIRKLQESLPYRPTRDRYKVYIVDEVHMLSQNAWNALLKTLEEPPPHVKFILATTEVHKVPVTILSRVQRFDFKMIPSRLIAERIRSVLQAEHIEADERAVTLVAREAAGSMRDALSLLDQVIAFNPQRLIGEEVARVLGVAGYTSLLEIAAALLSGEPARAIEFVGALAQQSSDLTVAARNLVALLRDLVVAKLCTQSDELLDLSDEERAAVSALAQRADVADLLRVQQGLARGFDEISRAPEVRTALEMLLTRLALRPALLPIDALITRLADLESRLDGGSAAPRGPATPPGAPRGPGGPPRSGPARPIPSSASAAESSSSREPSLPAPARPAPAPPRSDPAPTRTAAAPEPVTAKPEMDRAKPAPIPARSEPRAAEPRAVERPAPVAARSEPTAVRSPPAASTSVTAAPPRGEPSSPAPASVATTDVGGATLGVDDWRRVLDVLGETRPDFVAFLKHAVPLGLSPALITLGYEAGNVLEASLRSPECARELRSAASKCWGREPNIVFQPVAGGIETLAEADKKARERQRRAALDRAEQHPSVRDAAEILGARVKRIELGEGS